MPDNRNQDRELGERIGALTASVSALTREVARERELQDERHETNSDKLDQILGLKPMVESHDAWIKGPGADLHRAMTEFRGASRMTKFICTGLGLIGGGALYKLALAFMAALPK